jgi:hypothetical protein
VPSPNAHEYVAAPEDVLVNVTVKGTPVLALEVKLALGGASGTLYITSLEYALLFPEASWDVTAK